MCCPIISHLSTDAFVDCQFTLYNLNLFFTPAGLVVVGGTHMPQCTQRSRRTTCGNWFSLTMWMPARKLRMLGFGSQWLDPQHHLTGPLYALLKTIKWRLISQCICTLFCLFHKINFLINHHMLLVYRVSSMGVRCHILVESLAGGLICALISVLSLGLSFAI